jgi:hypothetical protein
MTKVGDRDAGERNLRTARQARVMPANDSLLVSRSTGHTSCAAGHDDTAAFPRADLEAVVSVSWLR